MLVTYNMQIYALVDKLEPEMAPDKNPGYHLQLTVSKH